MALPNIASTSSLKTVIVGKEEWAQFVQTLCGNYKVFGPTSKGAGFTFQEIKDAKDLRLDYQTTVLPPKKLLHQPFETMFHFTMDGNVTHAHPEDDKQILLGVHPCDVHAIAILDKVYMDEYPDPHYKQKRGNTIIIAMNCTTVGETCFCSSLGTGPALEKGYDVLITDLGQQYLLEAGSEVGEKLLSDAGLQEAPDSALVEKYHRVNEIAKKVEKNIGTDGLAELLHENFRHPVWDKLAQECLACGSCTMVCPTCFCYNVIDQVDLDLQQGKRQRVWDSCMLLDFGEVAMGGNFRKDRDARIKQRMYHKLKYMYEQFGMPGCVGCGRCINACIKKIDLTKAVEEIRGEDK